MRTTVNNGQKISGCGTKNAITTAGARGLHGRRATEIDSCVGAHGRGGVMGRALWRLFDQARMLVVVLFFIPLLWLFALILQCFGVELDPENWGKKPR